MLSVLRLPSRNLNVVTREREREKDGASEDVDCVKCLSTYIFMS